MFNPLKALGRAILPKPAFIVPEASGPAAGAPDDIFADSDFDQPAKPRLLTRIYEGLPGFVGGAGFMAATKCTTAALCSTVSAPALVTGAAVLGVGAFTSQTLTYIRERKAALQEIAAAQSPTGEAKVPSILRNLFNKEAVGRELRAFGQELKTAHFWKGAATKGIIAGGLGAAFSFAAHNDTVQHYAHKAVEAVRDSSLFQKLTSLSWTGKPAAIPAKVAPAAATASAPAPAASAASNAASGKIVPAAVEAPVAPKEPVTLLDKARALFATKGANSEAAEKMLGRTGVSEAQRVKDMAVGLGNGKYGFEVDQDTAKAAMKLAAENGNAQAARDIALNGKPLPVSASPAAPVAAPAAAGIVHVPNDGLSAREAAIADKAATQARAAAFIQENYGAAPAAAPAAPLDAASAAETPATSKAVMPMVEPQQVGNEAARCVTQVQETRESTVLNSICKAFKAVMNPKDVVLIDDFDSKVRTPFIYEGDGPVETSTFVTDALTNRAMVLN